MNEIPAWLQKDYVPVSVDIERAYEQDLIKYGRALPEGIIDTKVLAKYDEILINFEEYEFLGILLGPIIVSKGGKWGLSKMANGVCFTLLGKNGICIVLMI